jgi:hypothetical protein
MRTARESAVCSAGSATKIAVSAQENGGGAKAAATPVVTSINLRIVSSHIGDRQNLTTSVQPREAVSLLIEQIKNRHWFVPSPLQLVHLHMAHVEDTRCGI